MWKTSWQRRRKSNSNAKWPHGRGVYIRWGVTRFGSSVISKWGWCVAYPADSTKCIIGWNWDDPKKHRERARIWYPNRQTHEHCHAIPQGIGLVIYFLWNVILLLRYAIIPISSRGRRSLLLSNLYVCGRLQMFCGKAPFSSEFQSFSIPKVVSQVRNSFEWPNFV